MPHLRNLWTGMLTRAAPGFSGTDGRPILILNQNGLDVFHEDLRMVGKDLERGHGGLHRENIEERQILPSDDLEVRIGTRSDDLWLPRHLVVWGERATSGNVVPLAIETDVGIGLSRERRDENDVSVPVRISLPLRRVGVGSSNMFINRLLLVMRTHVIGSDPETDSPVHLRIAARGGVFFDQELPGDTPQEDMEAGAVNLHLLQVPRPFRRRDLNEESIVLSIRGPDQWRPATFVLFGLDDREGRPEFMVPLVHLEPWPFGPLSSDRDEGESSVTLNLAPFDGDRDVFAPDDMVVLAAKLENHEKRIRQLEQIGAHP